MIRRISKHNDLKDLIKSCPSGVIDDIYAIEYYIQGYNTIIQASFTKKETMLEVIIPSTDLETLPNGILMRRAYYKVLDASYPDGYYNLEFEDNMNVWIGENESEEPVIPEYVTEEELEETLEGYVTDQEFSGLVGAVSGLDQRVYNLENGGVSQDQFAAHVAQNAAQFSNVDANIQSVDDRVTVLEQRPVVSQDQFAAHVAANNESFHILQMVTDDHSQRIDALENAGDAMQQDLDTVVSTVQAVQNQVDSIDTIVSDLSDSVSDLDTRVTDLEQGGTGGGGTWGSITGTITDQQDLVDYVDGAIEEAITDGSGGYIWDIPIKDIQDQVDEMGNALGVIESSYVTMSDVSSEISTALSGYATETYVDQAIADAVFGSEIPVPTVFWGDIQGTVTDQQDLMYEFDKDRGRLSDLEDGTLVPTGTATETWVQNQGYITSSDLSGYATESWVQQQGYITSSALSGYATQSWSTDQFLEENKVWCGTAAQWANLTAEEKASYKIALVTA